MGHDYYHIAAGRNLEKGDSVVCGATYGHIRKMEDERGKEIEELNPSDVGQCLWIE